MSYTKSSRGRKSNKSNKQDSNEVQNLSPQQAIRAEFRKKDPLLQANFLLQEVEIEMNQINSKRIELMHLMQRLQVEQQVLETHIKARESHPDATPEELNEIIKKLLFDSKSKVLQGVRLLLQEEKNKTRQTQTLEEKKPTIQTESSQKQSEEIDLELGDDDEEISDEEELDDEELRELAAYAESDDVDVLNFSYITGHLPTVQVNQSKKVVHDDDDIEIDEHDEYEEKLQKILRQNNVHTG